MTRRSDSSWLLSALLCCAQALESVCLLYIRPRLNLSCFILLNTSSRPAHCWLVCVNLKSYFVLLNTSTRSARCWLVSASTFFCFVFLNPCSSTRCALYWEVSRSSLNTLTFIRSVLISSSALWRSSDFFLAHVSFVQVLEYFDHFLIAFKSISVLLLSELLRTLPEACHLACKELYAGLFSTLPAIYIRTWLIERSSAVVLRRCFKFASYKLCRFSCKFFRKIFIWTRHHAAYINYPIWIPLSSIYAVNYEPPSWKHSKAACRWRTLSDRNRICKLACHLRTEYCTILFNEIN